MQDFRNIKVWDKSHHLTLDVYQVSQSFPAVELNGLTGQLRKACSAISSNIAAGSGSGAPQDFYRFILMALASASEVEYQLLLARDLHYLEQNQYVRLNAEVLEIKQMLSQLSAELNTAS